MKGKRSQFVQIENTAKSFLQWEMDTLRRRTEVLSVWLMKKLSFFFPLVWAMHVWISALSFTKGLPDIKLLSSGLAARPFTFQANLPARDYRSGTQVWKDLLFSSCFPLNHFSNHNNSARLETQWFGGLGEGGAVTSWAFCTAQAESKALGCSVFLALFTTVSSPPGLCDLFHFTEVSGSWRLGTELLVWIRPSTYPLPWAVGTLSAVVKTPVLFSWVEPSWRCPNTSAATFTLLFLIWINEAGNTRLLISLVLFYGMSTTLAPEERGVCRMGFITSILQMRSCVFLLAG